MTLATKNQIREANELGCKLAAKIMLADRQPRFSIPDAYEWVGVNLLERDDELTRKVNNERKPQP